MTVACICDSCQGVVELEKAETIQAEDMTFYICPYCKEIIYEDGSTLF